MPDRRLIFAPLFLLAQALLVPWAADRERVPAPPTLSTFPAGFKEWRLLREDPIATDVAAELGADRSLSRTYTQLEETGSVAMLFVAWFQSQRAGTNQPHSPKVCLPASGWTPAVSGEVTIDTDIGAITVNRYIVVNGRQRDVVLYWYQGRRRVTAGEWAAKLWLIADALRDNRSDTALVRVVVPSAYKDDDAASAAAISFARNVYPLLRERLPQ